MRPGLLHRGLVSPAESLPSLGQSMDSPFENLWWLDEEESDAIVIAVV